MPTVISKLVDSSIPYLSNGIIAKWLAYFMRLSTPQKYCFLFSCVSIFYALKYGGKFAARATAKTSKGGPSKRKGSVSPALNLTFLRQMKFLLRIMIPRFWCPQVALLTAHTATLMAKTFLSIHVAKLEGTIVREIVKRDAKAFIALLVQWILIAIPACFLNSSIKFLESRLALSLRTRLVTAAYKSYFTNQVYYRVGNLDTRLQNPDHSLTEDISSFANSLAHLYSHITKPCLDSAMISLALLSNARRVGSNLFLGPTIALSVIYFTGRILKKCSPKFGQLVATEAELKARLRHCHSRIVMNSEEIAFYGGDQIEKRSLETAYKNEIRQSIKIYFSKLWYIIIEQFFMKYVWAGSGMVLVAIPILTAKGLAGGGGGGGDKKNSEVVVSSEANRTEYYMTTKNLLLAGGDAVERLMTSYKEVAELAGYASRVEKVFTVFDEVGKGNYSRESLGSEVLQYGTVTENSGSLIQIRGVKIITPNGDVIVPNLDLEVQPGMHLLITGPNGCGKSSLFRILSSLWPIYGGSLSRPPVSSLFYIPQRPYLSLGNLRDQVIYPDTYETMLRKGFSDDHLADILEKVRLNHIVLREGGWNSVKDWQDVLSGGEKQRIGLSRLFYHRPSFAFLDECTSAVSMDVEDDIYKLIIESGINLLTISHRPSLFKHHTHILKFHGDGNYTFQVMDLKTELPAA